MTERIKKTFRGNQSIPLTMRYISNILIVIVQNKMVSKHCCKNLFVPLAVGYTYNQQIAKFILLRNISLLDFEDYGVFQN